MATTDCPDRGDGGELIVFMPERCPGPARVVAGRRTLCFNTYLRFRQSGPAAAGFLIRSGDASYNLRLLRLLRKDPDYAASLIFVQGPLPVPARALSDGPPSESGTALNQRLLQVQQRRRALRLSDRSPEALLLAYLWLRPGFILRSQLDPASGRRCYPLLEAFGIPESAAEPLLTRLERSGLLAPIGAADLVGAGGRICPGWRLSAMGQLAVQVRSNTITALADTRRDPFADHGLFVGRLNWLWRVARARRSFSIGLVWLRPSGTAAGAQSAPSSLEQARLLQRVLQPADLVTRLEDETLLLLMPSADRSRLAALQSDLRRLSDNGGTGLHWHHAGVVINSRNAGEDEVASLVRSLQTALTPASGTAQVA